MFALYPHMNVRTQNISYPAGVAGACLRAQVKAKVAEVAKILGIEDILHQAGRAGLSGGRPPAGRLGPARLCGDPKAFP